MVAGPAEGVGINVAEIDQQGVGQHLVQEREPVGAQTRLHDREEVLRLGRSRDELGQTRPPKPVAEHPLSTALSQDVLASGQSFRRRGAVLTDLAAIGGRRQDPDQVLAYGGEALRLARTTSSGYVAHKLQGLRTDLGPLTRDARVAELGAEIDALCTT